jgi:hypothetical protein
MEVLLVVVEVLVGAAEVLSEAQSKTARVSDKAPAKLVGLIMIGVVVTHGSLLIVSSLVNRSHNDPKRNN